MAFENLSLDVNDGIAVVTVNRPDKLNALNRSTLEELNQAVAEVEADDSARVLVVTGAGEKAFVAGADIREISTLGAASGKEFALFGQEIFRRIECLGKPVIAAVNGYALGGGCELAMACHLRLASENAQFGQPEINLGIIPGYGGTQRLTRLVGRAKALELILTGDRIKADRALELGLVNAVFETQGFMDRVMDFARRLSKQAPAAVRYALEAVNLGTDMPLEEGSYLEATLFALCAATEDMKEGTGAFLEKRKAEFKGR